MSTPSRLTSLPLFPLRTVLFPDARLPLQIFEVRYLDMIAKRHKSGEPFGVVCLSEGTEVLRAAGRAGGRRLCGRALPADRHAGEDRRTGAAAARPDADRLPGHAALSRRREREAEFGLWIADVELMAEDASVPVPDDLAPTRRALQHLLQSFEQTAVHAGDAGVVELPLKPPYRWDDCGWLANRWCELLPLDPQAKHRLMALENPALRLELVADALDRMRFQAPG